MAILMGCTSFASALALGWLMHSAGIFGAFPDPRVDQMDLTLRLMLIVASLVFAPIVEGVLIINIAAWIAKSDRILPAKVLLAALLAAAGHLLLGRAAIALLPLTAAFLVYIGYCVVRLRRQAERRHVFQEVVLMHAVHNTFSSLPLMLA